jgi:lysophospholipase L1-like esterase
MVKPSRTLGLLLIVFVLSLSVMAWFPADGIQITEKWTLKFPDWESFWTREDEDRKVALQELFDIYAMKGDSTAIKDSIQRAKILRQQEMKKLQIPPTGPHPLQAFAESLKSLGSDGGKLRVIHFGDSQIEGDRISGYLRHKWQSTYGGTGPGWLPFTEVVPSPLAVYTHSDNWIRYTVYGRSNSEVHKRYGLTGSFYRFLPEVIPDSNSVEQYIADKESKASVSTEKKIKKDVPATVKAWVELSTDRRGYPGTQIFERARITYGNVQSDIKYSILADGNLLEEGLMPHDSLFYELSWDLPTGTQSIRLEFEGIDSPDFYGISLEGKSGIVVDNIPMRGSSGTIFNKMDASVLSRQFSHEHTGLIILQYGGNSVPYVTSEEQAANYGKWFRSQIRTLKRLNPNASFLVIGPSDMSVKDKDKFITYTYLPAVRDALKAAAFEQGAAYWDLFEAMGGKGSMPSWVQADPPLASTDHIHFSPSGANRVAEWLYEAIQEALRDAQAQL